MVDTAFVKTMIAQIIVLGIYLGKCARALNSCYMTIQPNNFHKDMNNYKLWEEEGVEQAIRCGLSCYNDPACSSFQYSEEAQKCVAFNYMAKPTTSKNNDFVHFKIVKCNSVCDRGKGYVQVTAPARLCFKYFCGKITWDNAKRKCEKRNNNLLVMDTFEKVKAVKDFLPRSGFKVTEGWVGFRKHDRVFRWLNNVTLDANAKGVWSNGEPEKWFVSHDCGLIDQNGLGDFFCTEEQKRNYICQKQI